MVSTSGRSQPWSFSGSSTRTSVHVILFLIITHGTLCQSRPTGDPSAEFDSQRISWSSPNKPNSSTMIVHVIVTSSSSSSTADSEESSEDVPLQELTFPVQQVIHATTTTTPKPTEEIEDIFSAFYRAFSAHADSDKSQNFPTFHPPPTSFQSIENFPNLQPIKPPDKIVSTVSSSSSSSSYYPKHPTFSTSTSSSIIKTTRSNYRSPKSNYPISLRTTREPEPYLLTSQSQINRQNEQNLPPDWNRTKRIWTYSTTTTEPPPANIGSEAEVELIPEPNAQVSFSISKYHQGLSSTEDNSPDNWRTIPRTTEGPEARKIASSATYKHQLLDNESSTQSSTIPSSTSFWGRGRIRKTTVRKLRRPAHRRRHGSFKVLETSTQPPEHISWTPRQWGLPEKQWGSPEVQWGQTEKQWGVPEKPWTEDRRREATPVSIATSSSASISPLEQKFPELLEDAADTDYPQDSPAVVSEALSNAEEQPQARFVILGDEQPEEDSIDGELDAVLMPVSMIKGVSPTRQLSTNQYNLTLHDNGENNNSSSGSSSLASSASAAAKAAKKFGYVLEGSNVRRYRVEERTADGYIVGEYGILNNQNAFLRGVRYTADGTINPRLIHEALMKFLSLRR